MPNDVQLYYLGNPILDQDKTLDGVTLDIEAIDAGVTRRAADGRIYNQQINDWSKRRAVLTGSGMGPVFTFGALLRKEVVVTSSQMVDLAGVVVEVKAPTRDVYGKVDSWSITVEEY